MAHESVSPGNETEPKGGCPNILDLLRDPIACEDETDPERLERIRYGAECTFNATIDGLRAVGNLIFHCATYTNEPIDDQLQDIGWFIQEMSLLARRTQEIESAASHQQRKLEVEKARRVRS